MKRGMTRSRLFLLAVAVGLGVLAPARSAFAHAVGVSSGEYRLDGSTLYVAGSDVGWRIGTDGSGERRIFSSYDSITAIAVDDTSLYWTDAELRKMTK